MVLLLGISLDNVAVGSEIIRKNWVALPSIHLLTNLRTCLSRLSASESKTKDDMTCQPLFGVFTIIRAALSFVISLKS